MFTFPTSVNIYLQYKKKEKNKIKIKSRKVNEIKSNRNKYLQWETIWQLCTKGLK